MNIEANAIIKSTVLSFLPNAKVLLFGSMARGDFNADSDYDVLVITKETYSLREKSNWRGKLHKALVHALREPVDVLINSEEEVSTKEKLPGHIVRWAVKEGVLL